MELKLKFGVDNIFFSMSPHVIESIIGKPDVTKEIYKEDDIKKILIYNKQKLRLHFYKIENYRLSYIETTSEELTYTNLKIINESIDVVKKTILGKLITKWEIEEYDSFSVHFNEENWISLKVEFGVVDGVEIGVLFKDNDEYNWPELSKKV